MKHFMTSDEWRNGILALLCFMLVMMRPVQNLILLIPMVIFFMFHQLDYRKSEIIIEKYEAKQK